MKESKIVDIVLAHSMVSGERIAERGRLKKGSYVIITPRTVDRCRGLMAYRLFNPNDVELPVEDFDVLRKCLSNSVLQDSILVSAHAVKKLRGR